MRNGVMERIEAPANRESGRTSYSPLPATTALTFDSTSGAAVFSSSLLFPGFLGRNRAGPYTVC